jgi:hypothetical protein
MARVSTQPLTEMNTRNFPGGKGQPAHKADNLTAICVKKMWEPRHLTTLWAFTACYRDSFTFVSYVCIKTYSSCKETSLYYRASEYGPEGQKHVRPYKYGNWIIYVELVRTG